MTEYKTAKNKKKTKLEKSKEFEIVGESKPKLAPKPLPAKKLPQLTFDAWWVRSHKKHGFGPEMKEIIYKHFRARGFLKSKKFDDGLKDFGIKS